MDSRNGGIELAWEGIGLARETKRMAGIGYLNGRIYKKKQKKKNTCTERLYLIISMKGFIQIIRRLPVAV